MHPGIDPATLVQLDAAVPRYTSYPTVPSWTPHLPQETFDRALARLQGPASVYVHVPFCREQCWFCGCNMVVAGNPAAGDRYLDVLERQVATLPLQGRPRLERVHLGGGTPTWLSPVQLRRLFAIVDARFDRSGEVSVEIDPDVTRTDHLEALREAGLTRISIGVQSFDERVLHAINRPQDPARIRSIAEWSRENGLRGLNLDLIYGLPYQDRASLDATLDEVEAMRPDRIALYSFAHVPWVKLHQQNLPKEALPDPLAKAGLYLRGFERLTDAGYVPVGMDHFALPDDELAVAAAEGRLHRNFMGYTTRPDLDLVGLGVSAISEIDGIYAQQLGKLGAWYRAIRDGAPTVERGMVLTEQDRLRKDVITSLMCNLRVRGADQVARHGAAYRGLVADARPALRPWIDRGMVEVDGDDVVLTAPGRFAVRQIAALFDHRLGDSGVPFSRAV